MMKIGVTQGRKRRKEVINTKLDERYTKCYRNGIRCAKYDRWMAEWDNMVCECDGYEPDDTERKIDGGLTACATASILL